MPDSRPPTYAPIMRRRPHYEAIVQCERCGVVSGAEVAGNAFATFGFPASDAARTAAAAAEERWMQLDARALRTRRPRDQRAADAARHQMVAARSQARHPRPVHDGCGGRLRIYGRGQ